MSDKQERKEWPILTGGKHYRVWAQGEVLDPKTGEYLIIVGVDKKTIVSKVYEATQDITIPVSCGNRHFQIHVDAKLGHLIGLVIPSEEMSKGDLTFWNAPTTLLGGLPKSPQNPGASKSRPLGRTRGS